MLYRRPSRSGLQKDFHKPPWDSFISPGWILLLCTPEQPHLSRTLEKLAPPSLPLRNEKQSGLFFFFLS